MKDYKTNKRNKKKNKHREPYRYSWSMFRKGVKRYKASLTKSLGEVLRS